MQVVHELRLVGGVDGAGGLQFTEKPVVNQEICHEFSDDNPFIENLKSVLTENRQVQLAKLVHQRILINYLREARPEMTMYFHRESYVRVHQLIRFRFSSHSPSFC